MIWLPRADQPLVFAEPDEPLVRLRRGAAGREACASASPTRAAARAPGRCRSGGWRRRRGVTLSRPASVDRPGPRVAATRRSRGRAAAGDSTGFVVLRRGSDVRRIPYWLHVSAPRARRGSRTRGCCTAGRLPRRHAPREGRSSRPTAIPEQARRARRAGAAHRPRAGLPVRAPAAGRQRGRGRPLAGRRRNVRVSPRLVRAGDEDRIAGLHRASAPGQPVPGALLRRRAGRRRLPAEPRRLRPRLRHAERPRAGTVHVPLLGERHDAAHGPAAAHARCTDAGGCRSSSATGAPGSTRSRCSRWSTATTARLVYRPATGRVEIVLGRNIARGRHRLVFSVADYQETKNNENASGTLPNTRRLSASVHRALEPTARRVRVGPWSGW